MEDISDIGYRHANNVFKRFKLENLGDYHDLYVKSDTLLLAEVIRMRGEIRGGICHSIHRYAKANNK